MKKLSTYLLVMFMFMYWVLRIAITLMAQLGKDVLGVVPINMTFEIVLLFVFLNKESKVIFYPASKSN